MKKKQNFSKKVLVTSSVLVATSLLATTEATPVFNIVDQTAKANFEENITSGEFRNIAINKTNNSLHIEYALNDASGINKVTFHLPKEIADHIHYKLFDFQIGHGIRSSGWIVSHENYKKNVDGSVDYAIKLGSFDYYDNSIYIEIPLKGNATLPKEFELSASFYNVDEESTSSFLIPDKIISEEYVMSDFIIASLSKTFSPYDNYPGYDSYLQSLVTFEESSSFNPETRIYTVSGVPKYHYSFNPDDFLGDYEIILPFIPEEKIIEVKIGEKSYQGEIKMVEKESDEGMIERASVTIPNITLPKENEKIELNLLVPQETDNQSHHFGYIEFHTSNDSVNKMIVMGMDGKYPHPKSYNDILTITDNNHYGKSFLTDNNTIRYSFEIEYPEYSNLQYNDNTALKVYIPTEFKEYLDLSTININGEPFKPIIEVEEKDIVLSEDYIYQEKKEYFRIPFKPTYTAKSQPFTLDFPLKKSNSGYPNLPFSVNYDSASEFINVIEKLEDGTYKEVDTHDVFSTFSHIFPSILTETVEYDSFEEINKSRDNTFMELDFSFGTNKWFDPNIFKEHDFEISIGTKTDDIELSNVTINNKTIENISKSGYNGRENFYFDQTNFLYSFSASNIFDFNYLNQHGKIKFNLIDAKNKTPISRDKFSTTFVSASLIDKNNPEYKLSYKNKELLLNTKEEINQLSNVQVDATTNLEKNEFYFEYSIPKETLSNHEVIPLEVMIKVPENLKPYLEESTMESDPYHKDLYYSYTDANLDFGTHYATFRLSENNNRHLVKLSFNDRIPKDEEFTFISTLYTSDALHTPIPNSSRSITLKAGDVAKISANPNTPQYVAPINLYEMPKEEPTENVQEKKQQSTVNSTFTYKLDSEQDYSSLTNPEARIALPNNFDVESVKATDADGKELATRVVDGPNGKYVAVDQKALIDEFKAKYQTTTEEPKVIPEEEIPANDANDIPMVEEQDLLDEQMNISQPTDPIGEVVLPDDSIPMVEGIDYAENATQTEFIEENTPVLDESEPTNEANALNAEVQVLNKEEDLVKAATTQNVDINLELKLKNTVPEGNYQLNSALYTNSDAGAPQVEGTAQTISASIVTTDVVNPTPPVDNGTTPPTDNGTGTGTTAPSTPGETGTPTTPVEDNPSPTVPTENSTTPSTPVATKPVSPEGTVNGEPPRTTTKTATPPVTTEQPEAEAIPSATTERPKVEASPTTTTSKTSSDTTKQKENPLPNTATNVANTGIIGAILALIGSFFVFKRRPKNNEK